MYNLISNLEESGNDHIDYSDLKNILGEENEMLIDDIVQLVVADNFF